MTGHHCNQKRSHGFHAYEREMFLYWPNALRNYRMASGEFDSKFEIQHEIRVTANLAVTARSLTGHECKNELKMAFIIRQNQKIKSEQ